MIRRDERRCKENPIIERITVNTFKETKDSFIDLILSACQEEDIPLHPMHKDTRDDLDVRVGITGPLEVFLAIVLTGVHHH